MSSSINEQILKAQQLRKEKNGKSQRREISSSIENIGKSSKRKAFEKEFIDETVTSDYQSMSGRHKPEIFELKNTFIEDISSNVQVSLEMK